MEISQGVSYIIRGFIDAKNEHNKQIYGSFVALATRREVKFVSTWFSKHETPKEASWRDLLTRHEKKESDIGRDPSYVNNEDLFTGYLTRNSVLMTLVKNHNAKPAEQSISRYCLEQLHMRAVSFIEFEEAGGDVINYIENLKRAEQKKNAQQLESQSDEEDDYEDDDDGDEKGDTPYTNMPNEIFVKCDALLDPIGGIAMNELTVGDSVYAKLPADSVFFKLLAKTHHSFDGVVTAEVTGVLVNDLGTATVSIKLSDGVNGIMKLPGKVKIRVATAGEMREHSGGGGFRLSPEVVIAGGVCLVVGAAIMALYYAFD